MEEFGSKRKEIKQNLDTIAPTCLRCLLDIEASSGRVLVGNFAFNGLRRPTGPSRHSS